MDNGFPPICMGTDILPMWRTEQKFLKRICKRGKQYINYIRRKDWRALKKDVNFTNFIRAAYESGCFMFDTSRAYGGSEKALGEALQKIDREKVYIVSKVSNTDQRTIGAKRALELSLMDLGLDYIDCYLLHWPQTETWIDCWKELEELYFEGKCKAIGVCNCNIHHLEELKKHAKVMPMINQIEIHPLFTQEDLVVYCKQNGIQVMAYTSTGRNDIRLKNSKRLEQICEKYGKSLNQIILKWHIQNGIIPIFSSFSKKHIKDNLARIIHEALIPS